jgi:hypothetical protein
VYQAYIYKLSHWQSWILISFLDFVFSEENEFQFDTQDTGAEMQLQDYTLANVSFLTCEQCPNADSRLFVMLKGRLLLSVKRIMFCHRFFYMQCVCEVRIWCRYCRINRSTIFAKFVTNKAVKWHLYTQSFSNFVSCPNGIEIIVYIFIYWLINIFDCV